MNDEEILMKWNNGSWLIKSFDRNEILELMAKSREDEHKFSYNQGFSEGELVGKTEERKRIVNELKKCTDRWSFYEDVMELVKELEG